MPRARGRMLAWRISESVKVDKLPDDTARLLYTWLIAHCDNVGRFHGEPGQILAIVFPKRHDITSGQVSGYLQAMADLGLIHWYAVDGLRYLAIPQEAWKAHQRLDRAQRSDFPPPVTTTLPPQYQRITTGVSEVEVEVEVEREREVEVEVEGESRGETVAKPEPTADTAARKRAGQVRVGDRVRSIFGAQGRVEAVDGQGVQVKLDSPARGVSGSTAFFLHREVIPA